MSNKRSSHVDARAAGRSGLEIFQTFQHPTGQAGQFVLEKQRSLKLTSEDSKKTLYELIELIERAS